MSRQGLASPTTPRPVAAPVSKGESRGVKGRFDLTRSALALLAALLAAIGAYSAYGRLPIVPSADTAVLLLGAEALGGLVMAVWPGRQWSQRRRYVALAAAISGLVLMVPGPLISAILVPGCVCPGQPVYPALLGIGHQYWMLAGLVGFPVLLGMASLIPARSRPGEVPREPEASTSDL